MTPSPHDDDLPEETELPDASDLQLVDLDSQLARRRSPRQKLISVSAMAVIVLVATLAGLQYSHALPPMGLLGAVSTPTPMPSSRITGFGKRFTPQQIAISTNVAGGIITLDGAPVLPPAYGPFLTATLKNGANTLTLSDPPFVQRTCTISYPFNSGADTCRRISTINGAPLIDLTLGWDALALSQQQRVMATIATYLGQLDAPTWHTTVPAGQYYLTGYDPQTRFPVAKIATTTMSAALMVSVAPSDAAFADCQFAICPSQNVIPFGAASQPPPMQWMIEVHTTLTWKFAPATGMGAISVAATPPVTANVPTNAMLPTTSPSFRLALKYDAGTGWSVIKEATATPDQLFQSVCALGNQFIATAAAAQGINPGEGTSTSQPSIAGCRIAYPLITNGANGYSPQIVYRFGALLAGNDDAHRLFPTLPVAPATENAAVPS